MIWRCPRCHGPLTDKEIRLSCQSCAEDYQCIGGIPDLRLPGASWIDRKSDEDEARRLLAYSSSASVEELVHSVFSSRPDWNQTQIELRTRQVMTATDRLRSDVKGWLSDSLSNGGLFLEVGCGPGSLLAAAASEGWAGIGVDVSLVWLVVAQRLVTQCGVKPMLAAALAEALPLHDNSVSGVVSLDVIEHVPDRERYLSEIDRVTKPGGCIALSTPNRYSLAAEPHVAVWGVGWLPRRWQKGYVRWRSGKSYEFVQLLSAREAGRLIRQHTCFQADLLTAPVPAEEIARFPPYRALLARGYNRLISMPWTRGLLLAIGPFFRILGRKAGPDGVPGK